MLFSEIYGAYYNCMADILKIAVTRPPTREEIDSIIRDKGFAETAINLGAALRDEDYKIIRRDGTTPLKKIPSMPLTLLERRFLKQITTDPRFRLFGEEITGLDDVKPLFEPDRFLIFDRYGDGDPYTSEAYIRNFRAMLDAIRSGSSVYCSMTSGKGRNKEFILRPLYLEYSEKDDKFRVEGVSENGRVTLNLGRIKEILPSVKNIEGHIRSRKKHEVVFELTDVRNALERVLLHFAHFEKEAERLDRNTYRIKLLYDRDDETEILIRILSFGPMVKVISPDSFVGLVRDRLRKQMKLL